MLLFPFFVGGVFSWFAAALALPSSNINSRAWAASHHANELPQPNHDSTITPLTNPPNTTTPLTTPLPQCWPSVPSSLPLPLPPISDPADCFDALLLIIGDFDPDQPVRWTSRQSWHHDSCSVYLEPKSGSLVRSDTFSRGEIARKMLQVDLTCVTERWRWVGGKIEIGRGGFEVLVLDGILEEERGGVESKRGWHRLSNAKIAASNKPGADALLGESGLPLQLQPHSSTLSPTTNSTKPGASALLGDRALPLQLPHPTTLPTTKNSTAPHLPLVTPSLQPTCYPPSPPYIPHPPVAHPPDCLFAISKITESAPFYPETWSATDAWFYGSCAVWLVPHDPEGGGVVEDTFSREEVRGVAGGVWRGCVVEGEGRGGWGVVGGRGVWGVSVEAVLRGERDEGVESLYLK